MIARRTGLIACLLIAAGCGNSPQKARIQYQNPGGMWMPGQMKSQASTLRWLGVDNPQNFSDPMKYPLGAIVWLGGCSASFVSSEGLIATNYHCANGSIQFNSNSGRNLYADGFLARRRHEELPCETGKKVWITQEMTDVTEQVRHGLEAIADSLERQNQLESRIRNLVASREKPNAGIRCEVKSYYEGQHYFLIQYLELKDIRLVYAPPESLGVFGGDIDNWHWPRHTADFAFYRAYVSPSGQPAEYAKNNIPYRPRQWLRAASEPLNEHDVVLVAGFPGRTDRWETLDEVLFLYEKDHPMRIRILHEAANIYTTLSGQSEELKIKVKPSLSGVMNHLQLLELVQENITRADLIDEKIRRQTAFESWIAADRGRLGRWGTVLADIARVNAEYHRMFERDYLLHCIVSYVRMMDAAHTIVRMAEERPLPDAMRQPEYQERNWARLGQSLERLQSSYDPAIDKTLLVYYLEKLSGLPADQRQPLQSVMQGQPETSEQIRRHVDLLFSNALTLEDPGKRLDLFKNASTEQLQQSTDPFIQMALRLRPFTKARQQEDKRYEGEMAIIRPRYMQAYREYLAVPAAPDANGTLRVTFGTVKGYAPRPAVTAYTPFTTVQQAVQKHTGVSPFNAPSAFLTAAHAVSDQTAFYDPGIGGIPVNFLTDVDITGGNSGSATLNRKGEWTGLVFDGNSEGVASNFMFLPESTRGIHVDLRYILWIMKYVDHADHLLCELGIHEAL